MTMKEGSWIAHAGGTAWYMIDSVSREVGQTEPTHGMFAPALNWLLRGNGSRHGATLALRIGHPHFIDEAKDSVGLSVRRQTTVSGSLPRQRPRADNLVIAFTPSCASTTLVECWGPQSIHA